MDLSVFLLPLLILLKLLQALSSIYPGLLLKHKNDFNVDIKSDYTIINIEELFKILKKLKKEQNGKN